HARRGPEQKLALPTARETSAARCFPRSCLCAFEIALPSVDRHLQGGIAFAAPKLGSQERDEIKPLRARTEAMGVGVGEDEDAVDALDAAALAARVARQAGMSGWIEAERAHLRADRKARGEERWPIGGRSLGEHRRDVPSCKRRPCRLGRMTRS